MTINITPDSQNVKHLTHPKYRADIDGLRAIAVLSVVIFHAFPSALRGGFIGVDIFFVISGFLISGIIFENLERDSFSFVEFYSRRIKRIFPALLLVLISCYAFGWFSLLADEYKQLGKHIAGGAGFIANFMFWQESGYFDNASETKPLLHLWSLGIEEQFYIIWPLLLWVAWKRRFNPLIITLTILVASFVLNISKVRSDTVAMFYSPQTRFWELLLGSVLAYIALYKQNLFARMQDKGNILSVLGLTLIIIGVVVITKHKHFPGWFALLPTLGALLIIAAGMQAWLNRVVLSNRVLVWFGLISFPLYLWHWPLLSFARITKAETPSYTIRIAAVVIAIVLAWLTYQLLEKPVRFGNHSKAKTITLFILMAIMGSVGYGTYKLDGLGFRLQDRQEFSEYFENGIPEQKFFKRTGLIEKWRAECSFFDNDAYITGHMTQVPRKEIRSDCFVRDNKYEHAALIWGDSHAQHLNIGLKNNLPANWQLLQVASPGCVPDPHVKEASTTELCTQSNWFALKTIKEAKPDVVIVAQNLGQNIETFKQISEKLKSFGVKKIILIGPTPHWGSLLPKIILTKLWNNTPRRTLKHIDKQVLSDNAKLQQQFKPSDSEIFANVIDVFCNQEGCMTYLGDDKKTGITSWDYGHLSTIASDYLAKNLLVDLIVGNNTKTP
jgi:peptidoglycan/LPS O-acetylase OafA/YrhL